MGRFKRGCFYGCMGGLGLYIIEFLCSLLPYMGVPNLLFKIWLITSIVVGVAISVCVILYKRTSIFEMIFRFGIMGASYVIVVVVTGYTGITKFLYDVFGENMSSASDNVSGMLMLTFLTIVFCVCIVVMIVVTIGELCKRKLQNRKNIKKMVEEESEEIS